MEIDSSVSGYTEDMAKEGDEDMDASYSMYSRK